MRSRKPYTLKEIEAKVKERALRRLKKNEDQVANLQKLNFSKNQLILNKLKKFSYFNKYNSFNFSTETKEKSSIELIKILRSETSKIINKF